MIDGWKDTQILQSQLLTEIQGSVPQNIQLKRLSIRSELKTPVYFTPEECALDDKLVVQGVSLGDRAEAFVIGLRKDLMTTELMKATFESVKLASMRKQVAADGQSMRDFKLEGSALDGGGQ